MQMGNLKGKKWERMFEESRRFYDPEGISPTIPTNAGGHHEVKIGQVESRERERESRRSPSDEEEIEMFDKQYRIAASRGRDPENPSCRERGQDLSQRLELGEEGMANTLTTVAKDNLCVETVVRVRRLTPKECYRLMGFSDEDFEKARKVVSEGQLYKQAGNSIVVNVLMAIFENMRPYFAQEGI